MKRSQILRIVLGGQLLISTLKLFGEGGGGREGGDPYTNQHPTLTGGFLGAPKESSENKTYFKPSPKMSWLFCVETVTHRPLGGSVSHTSVFRL